MTKEPKRSALITQQFRFSRWLPFASPELIQAQKILGWSCTHCFCRGCLPLINNYPSLWVYDKQGVEKRLRFLLWMKEGEGNEARREVSSEVKAEANTDKFSLFQNLTTTNGSYLSPASLVDFYGAEVQPPFSRLGPERPHFCISRSWPSGRYHLISLRSVFSSQLNHPPPP